MPVTTRSHSITEPSSPPKRHHSPSPSPPPAKRSRRTRKRSQDRDPRPPRPSLVSRMKRRFMPKRGSHSPQAVASGSNNSVSSSGEFGQFIPEAPFELEYPSADSPGDVGNTDTDFYTNDVIMDTESVQGDAGDIKHPNEDNSDADEASVLSYLTDDGAAANNRAHVDTPELSMIINSTESLPASDDLGMPDRRRERVSPTASPSVSLHAADNNVDAQGTITLATPAPVDLPGVNTAAASIASSTTLVPAAGSMGAPRRQTFATLTVTDGSTTVGDIYHTAPLMETASQRPLSTEAERDPFQVAKSSVGSSEVTIRADVPTGIGLPAVNDVFSLGDIYGIGQASEQVTTNETAPNIAFEQQQGTGGRNGDNDQGSSHSPSPEQQGADRDGDGDQGSSRSPSPEQQGADRDGDGDQGSSRSPSPEQQRTDHDGDGDQSSSRSSSPETPLPTPEDSDSSSDEANSEASEVPETTQTAYERVLCDLDDIARTQLRLMEGMTHPLNRSGSQHRLRLIGLEHALRHRTILSQRAERLNNRYEAMQGLSRQEREAFQQAVLQLETDTCSETIRSMALGALLCPNMFTTSTSLPSAVAADMCRVNRETVALIREENHVRLSL